MESVRRPDVDLVPRLCSPALSALFATRIHHAALTASLGHSLTIRRIHMRKPGRIAIIAIAGFLLAAGRLHAQSAISGAIAGTVSDATGAVLPGVTVEASSPA